MQRIAITLGDPSGIGPEIVMKALFSDRSLRDKTVLVGSTESVKRLVRSGSLEEGDLNEYEWHEIPGPLTPIGKTGMESGLIARKSIEEAVGLISSGSAAGMCTAPINKESLKLGGSQFIDHTEMLRSLTGSEFNSTIFESGGLRVLFLTKHVSLRKSLESMSVTSIQQCIEESSISMKLLGFQKPRIALAAVNPHGGEGGIMGREELEYMIPAVENMRGRVNISGPYPADSIYYRASLGEFDLVISPYHDQGHIAAKMLDFHGTVSLNIGLPFLRTSVDHGTAFDIAGQNRADFRSMKSAILRCIEFSDRYRRNYEMIFS